MAVITLVSGQTVGGTTTTAGNPSVTPTLPNNPTPGNLVVVFWTLAASSVAPTCTVQDGNSNAFTATPSTIYTDGSNNYLGVYYYIAPSNANKAITVSISNSATSATLTAWAAEFAGVLQSGALESDATATNASSTSVAAPTLTTQFNNDLVFSGVFSGSAVSGVVPPWVGVGSITSSDWCAFDITGGHGTYIPGFTQSPAGTSSCIMVAFRADPAPPITRVGSNFVSGSGATGTTQNVVLPAAPTKGNLVVVGFAHAATGFTATCADSNGNTYFPVPPGPNGGTGFGVWTSIWYLPNAPANASATITLTTSASITSNFFAREYAGAAPDTPLDNYAWTLPTAPSAGTSINLPSLTPSHAGDLLFCVCFPANAPTINSPWSLIGTVQGGTTFAQDQIQTTALAQTPGATMTSGQWQAGIASFVQAGQKQGRPQQPSTQGRLPMTRGPMREFRSPRAYPPPPVTGIQFGGAGALSCSGAGATTLTPAMPAGFAAGNLLIAVCSQKSNETQSWSAGWNVVEQRLSAGGGNWHSAFAWKIAVGGDTSPTISWTSSVQCEAAVWYYTGTAPSGTPIGAFAGNGGIGNPSQFATITTTANNSLVALIQTVDVQSTGSTVSGFTTDVALSSATCGTGVTEQSKAVPTAGTVMPAGNMTDGVGDWVIWQVEILSVASAAQAIAGQSLLAVGGRAGITMTLPVAGKTLLAVESQIAPTLRPSGKSLFAVRALTTPQMRPSAAALAAVRALSTPQMRPSGAALAAVRATAVGAFTGVVAGKALTAVQARAAGTQTSALAGKSLLALRGLDTPQLRPGARTLFAVRSTNSPFYQVVAAGRTLAAVQARGASTQTLGLAGKSLLAVRSTDAALFTAVAAGKSLLAVTSRGVLLVVTPLHGTGLFAVRATSTAAYNIAAAARALLTVTGKDTLSGTAALRGTSLTTVQVRAMLQALLSGRSLLAVRATAVSTQAAAIAGKSLLAVRGTDTLLGTLGLAGRSLFAVRELGMFGGPVGLSARSLFAVQALARGTQTVALAGRTLTTVEIKAAALGLAAMRGGLLMAVRDTGLLITSGQTLLPGRTLFSVTLRGTMTSTVIVVPGVFVSPTPFNSTVHFGRMGSS